MERVTVFRFKVVDEGTDTETIAPRAATVQTISRIMDATPIAESAQIVDSHCIDSQGFLVERYSSNILLFRMV
jgi:hypothetical protein